MNEEKSKIEEKKITSNYGYKIMQTVYLKPGDHNNVVKGVIVGFEEYGNRLPIVEGKYLLGKKMQKFKISCDPKIMSKTPTVTLTEWKLVNVKYKYKP